MGKLGEVRLRSVGHIVWSACESCSTHRSLLFIITSEVQYTVSLLMLEMARCETQAGLISVPKYFCHSFYSDPVCYSRFAPVLITSPTSTFLSFHLSLSLSLSSLQFFRPLSPRSLTQVADWESSLHALADYTFPFYKAGPLKAPLQHFPKHNSVLL